MDPAIDIENLAVSYRVRGGMVDALRGIDLRVETGEVFGFLGPNGSGKTTAMMVMLGFIRPNGGDVRLFGSDVRRSIARRRIGYLPEHPDSYGYLTGRELLINAGGMFGLSGPLLEERARGLLDRLGLADAGSRRIATYSRGMLQRIGLAQSLVNDPDLLILDEPTGGMDPLGRLDIRALIEDLRGRGKTVFFSSHELSEVERVCDRIAVLSAGRICASGPLDELVAGRRDLEQYFVEVVRQ